MEPDIFSLFRGNILRRIQGLLLRMVPWSVNLWRHWISSYLFKRDPSKIVHYDKISSQLLSMCNTSLSWRSLLLIRAQPNLSSTNLSRYRKVTSSRPVYYSILDSFGQMSQHQILVLLTKTVYCLRLYGNPCLVQFFVCCTDKNYVDKSCYLVKHFLDFPLWEKRIAYFK